jgi:hypothetical protein
MKHEPSPAGIKREPWAEDVQCPGRAIPVPASSKLAVPAGLDLAQSSSQGLAMPPERYVYGMALLK